MRSHAVVWSRTRIPPSNQLYHDASAYNSRRPLQARERDVVFGIEEPVNLRAARFQQDGHSVLRDFLLSHSLSQLPGYYLLDRLRLRLFEDALLLEKVVNARTYVPLAQRSNSFWRFRAAAKSSSEVARVFLMNPCNTTRYSR